MLMTAEQCRAARALLGWSIGDLAAAAAMGVMTINRLEGGQVVRASSAEKLAATLAQAGIIFVADGEVSYTGGEGVRLAVKAPSAAD